MCIFFFRVRIFFFTKTTIFPQPYRYRSEIKRTPAIFLPPIIYFFPHSFTHSFPHSLRFSLYLILIFFTHSRARITIFFMSATSLYFYKYLYISLPLLLTYSHTLSLSTPPLYLSPYLTDSLYLSHFMCVSLYPIIKHFIFHFLPFVFTVLTISLCSFIYLYLVHCYLCFSFFFV